MNMKELNGDKTCWVRRRWLTDNAQDLHLDICNPLCHYRAAKVLLSVASAALKTYAGVVALIPIPIDGIIKSNEIIANSIHLDVLAHDPRTTGGTALAESLNAVWRAQIDGALEWLVAEVNHSALGSGLGDSMGQGRRGPGWQVMAGVTEDSVADCYRSNAIELIFSTETSAYVDFVNRLLDDIKEFRTGGYISIRFSSRGDAYSPCTRSELRWRYRLRWFPFMACKTTIVGSHMSRR